MISRPAPCNSFSTFRTSVRSEVVRYHLTVIMFNYDKSSIVWFINVLLEQKGLGFHESFPEDGTPILNSWLSLKKLLIIPSFWLHSLPPAPSCHHTLKSMGRIKMMTEEKMRKEPDGVQMAGNEGKGHSHLISASFIPDPFLPTCIHPRLFFLSPLVVLPYWFLLYFFLYLDPYFSFCSSW